MAHRLMISIRCIRTMKAKMKIKIKTKMEMALREITNTMGILTSRKWRLRL